MIYDGREGAIINQYVIFTKVCSEQVALYGKTRKAIMEAIRICKDRNVLKEYLTDREKEVINIMTLLLTQEEIAKSYIESEKYESLQEGLQEGLQKGRQEERIEMAKRLLKQGKMTLEEISVITNLSLKELETLIQPSSN